MQNHTRCFHKCAPTLTLAVALMLFPALAGAEVNLSQGLVAYWTFDETVGPDLIDISGNGHHGQHGSATLIGREGVSGGAYEFSKDWNNVVIVPDHTAFAFQGEFAVTGWIRLKEFAPGIQNGKIFGGYTRNEYSVAITTEGIAFFYEYGNDVDQYLAVALPASIIGEWHHFLAQYDAVTGTQQIWWDGVQIASVPAPAPQLQSQDEGYGIGGEAFNYQPRVLSSFLDELRVYSRALYPEEIRVLSDLSGPVTSQVVATPNPVAISETSTLSAHHDDTETGGSNIASAVYRIADGSGVEILGGAMTPHDGFFDSPIEDSEALIPGGSFATAGVNQVCVSAADSRGNTGPEACEYFVVFDPVGGFVTGGGKTASPAGADLENPAATGPVNFGFNARYHQSGNTPEGSLQFQFKAGNLKFHSTSIEWLVVTDEPRAVFRGEGLVNDETSCEFEVDTWDGSLPPTSEDALGLRLFACDGETLRYVLPATQLTSGNIKIHR